VTDDRKGRIQILIERKKFPIRIFGRVIGGGVLEKIGKKDRPLSGTRTKNTK